MTDERLYSVNGSALRFLIAGEEERPRSLVVLLHGSGSHAYDLLEVAEAFAKRLPRALFIIPNAARSVKDDLTPEQIAATEKASPWHVFWNRKRTWAGPMNVQQADRDGVVRGLHDALTPSVQALAGLVDFFLARFRIEDGALAIYGFSQGGLVAVHLGLARAKPCAGIVCHSGHFIGSLDVRSRPPALLVFGAQELAPSQGTTWAYVVTLKELEALGVPFEEYVSPGLGHGVNKDVVERVCRFLSERLN